MRRWIALWFVLIALVSLAPLRVKNAMGTTGILHSAGHMFVFAVSGVMLLAFADTPISRVWRVLFIFLFCASLEALQTVIYHNHFEWSDLFIDYLAVGISPFLLHAIHAVSKKLF